ncbi:MAG TPA: hypothetical protein VIG03_10245 [Steroidobacteraceae bacterium]|jgi:hypothetical protein
MSRKYRVFALAAGLAFASAAALADPSNGAYDARYEQNGDYDYADVVHVGRQYVTHMPYDPGERVRIRVDVTPVSA